MARRAEFRRSPSEGGYALILAIVVLAALLAIATPFLLTTRSSSRSSVSRLGDVRARLEIDAVERALWRRLESTDPEQDTTPYYDTLEEARTRLAMPPELYKMRDITDAVVSAEAATESGRIDLNTANAYALSLAMGHGFLTGDLKKDQSEISIDNGEGFPDKGYLWIRGELIQYSEKKGGQFLGCTRGIMGSPAGPYEIPNDYRTGTPVVDARAHAIAKHRIRAKNGEFKAFSTIHEILRVQPDPENSPRISPDDLRKFENRLTTFGERGGHDWWSAAYRITSPIQADGLKRTFSVDLPRYFGIGTTVRIEGPEGVEYGLVVASSEDSIQLEEPLRFSAPAYTAQVRFLVPSPIHINSASADLLEDMLTGLDAERAATPEPVDREAAKRIVERIRQKPVRGQQDLVQEVLLPLVQDGTLKPRHLEAILRATEHSNDRMVKFATVPFSYTIGSRYRVLSAASVQAPSGIERGRVENESIVEVHPQARAQGDAGLRLVARQVEFDELFRLSRRGRGWMTYPYNSTSFDGRSDPPSRARSFLNILGRLGESFPFVQSDEPEKSFAQLAPGRDAFPGDFAEHFDADLTIEGHDVRTLGPYRTNPAGAPARFAGQNGLYLYPGSISGWVRWDLGTVTGTIFDVGASASLLRDHISLSIEKGDLVARMRDPAGDDDNSLANVAGEARNEIRYPASQLKPNVWYHFTIEFKGSGPTDWTLLVDGIPRGSRALVTQLAGKLDPLTQLPTYGQIPVESTEGFPQFGVLKVGGELIEYTSKSAKAFITNRTRGNNPGSYTGGRGARESYDSNSNLAFLYQHEPGETVELYGYVNKLMKDVFPGGGQVKGGIGRFTAAHVSRFTQGLTSIDIGGAGPQGQPQSFLLGKGFEAGVSIPALKLVPLDVMEPNTGGTNASCDPDFIKGFASAGGYAVMFQFRDNGTNTTTKGSPLFGAELIRYGGISGTDTLTNVTRMPGGATPYFRGSAFVVDWQNNIPLGHQNNNYQFWVFVVPCSIPLTGGTYETPPTTLQNGDYIAAQLIELGAQGVGLDLTTEWIQYDTILNSEMCVLADWRWAGVRGITQTPPTVNFNVQPPQLVPQATTFPNPPPGCVNYQANDFSIGEPTSAAIPTLVDWIANGSTVTGAGLRFRGTNGTWSREHNNTTEVIPCFLAYRGSVFGGRPGRHDRFRFLFPQDITFAAYDPYLTINWTSPYKNDLLWVATKEKLPGGGVPINQTAAYNPEIGPVAGVFEDSRNFFRIAKTPTGELPTVSSLVAVGGRYDGPGDEIPGTIDEVEFTSPLVQANQNVLGKLIVDKPFSASSNSFTVSPIVPSQPYSVTNNPIGAAAALPGFAKSISGQVLALLPADAGIVMIGEELIGYDTFDAASGQFTVAVNGRGMLGTRATAHGAFETAVFLDHFVVTQLTGGLSPGASKIPAEDLKGFPPEGTLLIGSELIHYTRLEGPDFAMPEYEDDSALPGDSATGTSVQLKKKGNGLFRGRYGSIPMNHSPGEIIFRFPWRYADRWVLGADAPEMHYLQMDEGMAAGFYRRVSWQEELPLPGVTFENVVRLDARSPWTAEANRADGLWLFTRPQDGEKSNWIMRQGERLESRFGVRYGLGSFTPIDSPITNATVRNDAWKTTPRLRAIATERFGATKVLWREERR